MANSFAAHCVYGLCKRGGRQLCFGFVLILLAVNMASACVCPEQDSLADEYQRSRAVFVGRIVSIELATTFFNGDRAENMIATFEIERRWKGPAVRRLRVQTCGTQMMICTCGADFQLGQRYVVFANGKQLETGSCSRTTIVNPEDDEFVKKVNDVAKAKSSNHKFQELQLSKQRLTVANNWCGRLGFAKKF